MSNPSPLTLSLNRLYCSKQATPTDQVPYQWQAPLMRPEQLEDWAEFERRVTWAGQLWLQNRDLRPYCALVITNLQARRSYVFQRPMRPGDKGFTILGHEEALLQTGEPVGPYPLLFVEFDVPFL